MTTFNMYGFLWVSSIVHHYREAYVVLRNLSLTGSVYINSLALLHVQCYFWYIDYNQLLLLRQTGQFLARDWAVYR
jgi:hypothetical protein